MTEPTWWTYIKQVAQTETVQPIADAAGVSGPQVSRWKSGENKPRAETLIQFARHHGRPPLEALIAGGYLTAQEARVKSVEIRRRLTNMELADEVRQRLMLADDAERGVNTKGVAAQDRETARLKSIKKGDERNQIGQGG
jgi:transcriptional regulator with XRE-family HTH domain